MAQSVVEIVIKAVNQTKAGLQAPINDFKSFGAAVEKIKPAMMAAGAATVSAVAVMVKQSLDAADAMYQMSQRTGESVEFLSQMKYAAEQSDTSVESLQKGLKTLAGNMAEAAAKGDGAIQVTDDFAVSVKNADGSLRKTGDVMLEVAGYFKKHQDGAAKSAAAVALFGKAGEELIPMLNEGADGLAAMQQESDALGATISGNTAAAAAAFNDNVDKLTTASGGLAMAFTSGLVPSLETLSERFVDSAKQGGGLRGVLMATGEVVGRLMQQFYALGKTAWVIVDRVVGGVLALGMALDAAVKQKDIPAAKAIMETYANDTVKALDEVKGAWGDAFNPAIPQKAAEAGGDAIMKVAETSDKAAKEEKKRREDAAKDAAALLQKIRDENAQATLDKQDQILREHDAQIAAIESSAMATEQAEEAKRLAFETTDAKLRDLWAAEDAEQAKRTEDQLAAEESANEKRADLARQISAMDVEFWQWRMGEEMRSEDQLLLHHIDQLSRIQELKDAGAEAATVERLTTEEQERYEQDVHDDRVRRLQDLLNMRLNAQNAISEGLDTLFAKETDYEEGIRTQKKSIEAELRGIERQRMLDGMTEEQKKAFLQKENADKIEALQKKLHDLDMKRKGRAEQAIEKTWLSFRDGFRDALIDSASKLAAYAITSAIAGELIAMAWAPAATASTIATAGGTAAAAPFEIKAATMATKSMLSGVAHDGLDRVDRTGSYLLKQGEMVLNPRQAESARENFAKGGGGQTSVVVNLDGAPILKAIAKASKDGRLEIDGRAVK